MTNIRWGIVGTGSIATAFAHSIKYSNNSSLEAVYGRNESKLKDFCSKFEAESINEPNNLFTADHIDAIYIATPHSTHYEYCLSAIRNKKHILCEKPLTVNHLESMVLLNLAKESNVFLMEAFMYRAHPQTANILDSLDVFQDSKEEIIIESSFGFTAELSESHRLRNPMLGGGAILDVGCYPLSISKLIAGRIQGAPFSDPESIEASGRIDSTGVDLQSTATLVFSDRIKAEISCAIDEEYSNNLIVKSGDLKMVASQPWHCGQFQEGKSSIEIYKNQQLIKEIPFEDKVGLFTREINHASECIAKGEIESNYINHADTQSNMLWLEKWRQQLDIVCPLSEFKGSPLPDSKFYLIQRPKVEIASSNGVEKLVT